MHAIPFRRRSLRPAARSLFCLLLCALLLMPAAPASGQIFGGLDVAQERELGRKFDLLVRNKLPMIDDPEITGYIQELVQRIATAMPDQPWTLTSGVAKQNPLNAFAGPAGHVFVFSGLIANLEHESDLAAVMAHELAHVSQRHLAKKVEKSQLTTIATLLGMVAGAFLGGSGGQALTYGTLAVGQSAMLGYSRDDEREADDVGLKYLMDAGWQPKGMVRAFEVLRRKQWIMGGNIPTYLSTHPGIQDRIAYLEDRIATLPAAIRNRGEDDRRFLRVRTLIRARYQDTELALATYPADPPKTQDKTTLCLHYLGRGVALDTANRRMEAKDAFEKALSCGGSDPLVLREAGRHYFEVGNFNRAGLLLQKAIALDSNDLMALFFYSRILADDGQLPAAINYMERVGRAVPRDWEVHQHLGRMYGQNGQLFRGHLHMAYSSLYTGDLRQARFHAEKAKAQQRTEDDRREMESFQGKLKEIEELTGRKG